MEKEKQGQGGKTAVVTGANRGIGEAVAQRLATLGYRVLLVARDRERLEAVASGIRQKGGQAEAAPLNLREPAASEHLRELLEKHGHRCDVLVNNAAVGRFGAPLHQMSPEAWDETLETNLRAPFLAIRAVAPLMIAAGTGDIINISSLAGHNPLPNGAAYAASKWGLNGLTYSVAEELRPHGIRVSVVAPGSVNTSFGGGGGSPDDERAARKLQPSDIADVVAMLVGQAPRSFVSEVLMRPTRKP